MSKKYDIPVTLAGKFSVPVDFTMIDALRTDMQAEGLHDAIVVEAVRLGVCGSLAGFQGVKMKRELAPPTSSPAAVAAATKTKKQPSSSLTAAAAKDFSEFEGEMNAASAMADSDATRKALEEQAEALKAGGAKRANGSPSAAAAEKRAPPPPYDNQVFTAVIDITGLQKSIERVISAYDSMSTRVETAIAGPLAALEKLSATLPPEAQAALVELKAGLQSALEPPASTADDAAAAAANASADSDEDEYARDADDDEAGKGLLGGDHGGDSSSDDDDQRPRGDPASMGYQALGGDDD